MFNSTLLQQNAYATVRIPVFEKSACSTARLFDSTFIRANDCSMAKLFDIKAFFKFCFAFGTLVLHRSVQEDFKMKLLPQSLLHPAFRGDDDGSCLIHVLRRHEASKERKQEKEA